MVILEEIDIKSARTCAHKGEENMKYYVAYIENGKSFKDNYIHTIILEYPKEI